MTEFDIIRCGLIAFVVAIFAVPWIVVLLCLGASWGQRKDD